MSAVASGTKKQIIALLLILPLAVQAAPKSDLWDVWAVNDARSTRVVDHSSWQHVLDSYLAQAPDGINRFDYSAVTASDRQMLADYVDSLTSMDPRQLRQVEQFAYWINLYNALTVEVVLRHPKKGSILRMGKGLFSIGPWNDPLISIAGETLSLNDIEHRILRPIWQDHRIHYAVNCASLGCPNLRSQAYTAENLDRQLSQAEDDFINHPRSLSFTDEGKLRLSSIYKWYRLDFAADEAALLDHLADRHQTLSTRIREHESGIEYRYDWKLNHP